MPGKILLYPNPMLPQPLIFSLAPSPELSAIKATSPLLLLGCNRIQPYRPPAFHKARGSSAILRLHHPKARGSSAILRLRRLWEASIRKLQTIRKLHTIPIPVQGGDGSVVVPASTDPMATPSLLQSVSSSASITTIYQYKIEEEESGGGGGDSDSASEGGDSDTGDDGDSSLGEPSHTEQFLPT